MASPPSPSVALVILLHLPLSHAFAAFDHAVTDLLTRVGNVISMANFDPSYFMQGMDQLSAFDAVLSFLKLLAVGGRRAFAAARGGTAVSAAVATRVATVTIAACRRS